MTPDLLVLIVDLSLLSSEAESTCLSPCQSTCSNMASSETIAHYQVPPKSTKASNDLIMMLLKLKLLKLFTKNYYRTVVRVIRSNTLIFTLHIHMNKIMHMLSVFNYLLNSLHF